MNSLKNKEYKLSEIYVHRKTQKVYMSENVKESILDLYKYNEYKQEILNNGKSDKSMEIHLYFKDKYNIRLFESNNINVYKIIFGDWEN